MERATLSDQGVSLQVHSGFFTRVKKYLNYLKGSGNKLCPVFQYCFFGRIFIDFPA